MLRQTGPFDVSASHSVAVTADLWLAANYLGSLPILEGSLTENADQQIPEAVSFSVAPVGPDGTDYRSLIGSDGHRVRLTYRISSGTDTIACPLGWYRIDSFNYDGTTIAVTASGLLSIISDYKLLAPTSPAPGATLGSEIKRLTEAQLPVIVAASGDRAASSAMAWTEDRVGALYDLVDAWPAVLNVDPNGTLWVTNVAPWTAEITLTEGEGGTVIKSADSGSRDGIANIIVARGEDSTDPARTPVTGIARDLDPTSPTYVLSYGPVVQFYSSPLLTTTVQANQAAKTVLDRTRRQAVNIPVSIIPDPRIKAGTNVQLNRQDGRVQKTTVTALSLPLSASGGEQTLTLGVVG